MADKTRDNANAEAARTLLEKNRRIFEGDRTLWIIYTVLLVVSILWYTPRQRRWHTTYRRG